MSNRVIKFSAEWCGPCRAMAPTFKKFQESHANEAVSIEDVNVDIDYELASKYEIRSIPHIVFVKNGEVVDRVTGVANIDKLNVVYDRHFN